MTSFASVAMLEKLALLKIALCKAPASSSTSSAGLAAKLLRFRIDTHSICFGYLVQPSSARGKTLTVLFQPSSPRTPFLFHHGTLISTALPAGLSPVALRVLTVRTTTA